MTSEAEWVKLLGGLTVEELSNLYLSREDFDMLGACFGILLARPAGPVVAHGRKLARSAVVEKRAFAPSLLSMGIRRRGRGWESALALLVSLMDDPEPEVVGAAATAYGHLHIWWSSDQAPRARAQRDDASLIPWPEPLPTTLDPRPLSRLAGHPEPWVRMELASSLMLWADPSSVGVLLTLSKDEDPTVSASAASSMGWLSWAGGCTPEVLDRLWELAREPDDERRVNALAALLRLRQRAVEPLVVAEIERNYASQHIIYPIVHQVARRREFIPQSLLALVEPEWKPTTWGMTREEFIAGGAP